MIDIDTATRNDLENEMIFNDELYDYLTFKYGSAEDFIQDSSLEVLRETCGNWVIENSDV